MLPRILCENLCSLNPGCERLTFTLWIVLDIKGQIVEKPRFSRSVIKSKARFTYEQAQLIIEGKINSQEELEEGFGCTDKADFQAIASDIKLLHQISTELRKRRVERGSLFF
jgi:exoribonuclease R